MNAILASLFGPHYTLNHMIYDSDQMLGLVVGVMVIFYLATPRLTRILIASHRERKAATAGVKPAGVLSRRAEIIAKSERGQVIDLPRRPSPRRAA